LYLNDLEFASKRNDEKLTPLPRVSIVMATYNYAQYLSEAIESVLAQTFEDWELLVIDDGSTDGTAELLESYAADTRIRIIASDNLGQPRAKNLGIRLSRASLIAFLDGDDRWRRNKLARQLEEIESNPTIGVLATARQLIDPDGNPIAIQQAQKLDKNSLEMFLERNPLCFSSVLIRKELLESFGLFDPRYPVAIDYDLWLRLAERTEFQIIDEVLVEYRTGHANLSSRLEARIAVVLQILQRILGEFGRGKEVRRHFIREAFGSCYRSLGWAQSRNDWPHSITSYFEAALYDGHLLATLRSSLAVTFKQLMKRRG
jgi:glycosyltransferase involved in cell wall biosynthesis